MKKYISAFVCGFSAGVLYVVPVVKSLSCCLVVPLASFFSLLLDHRANPTTEKITIKKGAMFGLITGLYAALFGTMFELLITLITKNNDVVMMFSELQKMISNFPFSDSLKNEVLNLLEVMRTEILQNGFSPLYTISLVLNNTLINSVVGLLGGIIGTQIINQRLNLPKAD